MFDIWEQLQASIMRGYADKNCSNPATTFAKYLLNRQECKKKTVYFDEEKYQKIMSETLDVVESEDFNSVLVQCVKESLEKMMVNLEDFFLFGEGK